MKKLFVLGIAFIFLAACNEQKQRYFAESAETKTLESGIAAYESGDWDKWRSHFADTAKIYVNSRDAMTVEARMKNLDETTKAWSSYGFDKETDYIEMVLDKEDETWVYYWGLHSGTLVNGKELSMPVHLAVQFNNGKITEEHIYFDATEMNEAMREMQAEAESNMEGAEEDENN